MSGVDSLAPQSLYVSGSLSALSMISFSVQNFPSPVGRKAEGPVVGEVMFASSLCGLLWGSVLLVSSRLHWPSLSPRQPQLEMSPGPHLSLGSQTRSQLAAALPATRAASGKRSQSEIGKRTRREQILWLTNWAALAKPWAASSRRTWEA